MRGLNRFFAPPAKRGVRSGIDWPAYLIIIGALCTWFLITPLASGSATLLLRDPDNYQRLVEVRDWLGGQSWWDVTQYRMAPPAGIKMHWSRLADVPLGALIRIFSLFAEPARAEVWGVIALPPLLLLTTLIALGRAARNIGGHSAESFCSLLVISVAFVLTQFMPGRIDHHGLQLLMLALALSTATGESTWRIGFLTALPISISLVIGLETAPLLVVFPLWFASRWLALGDPQRAPLAGFISGMIMFLPAFYILSVPLSDWMRPTFDEVGRAHLAIVLAGGIALLAAIHRSWTTLSSRAAALSIAGLIALAPLAFFPEILSPPYRQIDPMLQHLWMDGIAETASAADIAKSDPLQLVKYHLFPIAAVVAATLLYLHSNRDARLLLVIALGLVGFALTLWQLRTMTAASLIALLLISIVCGQLWDARRRPYGLPLALAAPVFLNGWVGPVIYDTVSAEPEEKRSFNTEAKVSNCEVMLRDADLDKVPPGLILNDIDNGARILVRSRHSILASSNHRNVDGNLTAYRALTSPPDDAHRLMLGRGVNYVLLCKEADLGRLAKYAPHGLAHELLEDNVPDWLEPIHNFGGKGLLFYNVKPAKLSAENPESAGSPSK